MSFDVYLSLGMLSSWVALYLLYRKLEVQKETHRLQFRRLVEITRHHQATVDRYREKSIELRKPMVEALDTLTKIDDQYQRDTKDRHDLRNTINSVSLRVQLIELSQPKSEVESCET